MSQAVTAESLHRTAKYFMDNGRARSHGEAMAMLCRFGLNIALGPEIQASRDHQIALLTLVNAARRTFLAGVRVVGVTDANLLAPLVHVNTLADAVKILGGTCADAVVRDWPTALIGTTSLPSSPLPSWQVTWDGWRGGVIPVRYGQRLPERPSGGFVAALAAGVCAAEVFAHHAADHPAAGSRAAGLSLWRPDRDWLVDDEEAPAISYLPSNLWLIGLGNLGQAYLWLLGCLNYEKPSDLSLMLQDTDRLSESNDSTSLLTQMSMVGKLKTRILADWCEARGFHAALDERQFGARSKRGPFEPAVALCGVDNVHTRSSLERAGFGLVIETGLGAGPQSFKNLSLHAFPSSLSASKLWGLDAVTDASDILKMPAYEAPKHAQLDECGLAQLASRTVGVPFVGLISASLAIAELLRRLHGGQALELVSLSTAALEDAEISPMQSEIYEFGHAKASS